MREDRDIRGSSNTNNNNGNSSGTTNTTLTSSNSETTVHRNNGSIGSGGSAAAAAAAAASAVMANRGEEEWKNIHTMLNCISAMVDKTKRAITILQQRGVESTTVSQSSVQHTDNSIAEMKRQTEEKVAEFRRNAEEAVNQVKRQAVIEIQRAVAAAEAAAVEALAQERIKLEKMFAGMWLRKKNKCVLCAFSASSFICFDRLMNICRLSQKRHRNECRSIVAAHYRHTKYMLELWPQSEWNMFGLQFGPILRIILSAQRLGATSSGNNLLQLRQLSVWYSNRFVFHIFVSHHFVRDRCVERQFVWIRTVTSTQRPEAKR